MKTGQFHVVAMMCSLLLLAIVPVVASAEDPVHFGDAILKWIVEMDLGVENPTPSQMLALTELDAEDKDPKITSLVGLEYATNLTRLLVGGNSISDLTPIGGLTKLQYLRINRNQVASLAPIAGLTNLTKLYANTNQISSLVPVSAMTKLTNLGVAGNSISSIVPLAGLTGLTDLSLNRNPLGNNIGTLASLTNVAYLHISDIGASDISVLSSLTKLVSMEAAFNHIVSISPLSGLTGLTTISLLDNQISDISPVAWLPSGAYLDVRDNQLSPASCAIIKQLRAKGVEALENTCGVVPPVVYTEYRLDLTSVSAKLCGKIQNDGREACLYRFAYHEEGGSEQWTPWECCKVSGEYFSFPLNGLKPGTTYYYCAQAKNSGNTPGTWSSGDTMSITTIVDGQPMASAIEAQILSETSAVLKAAVLFDGGSACQYIFGHRPEGLQGYNFQSDPTGAVRTGATFALRVDNLKKGRTYYFAAMLKSTAGQGPWSNEVRFTVPDAGPELPPKALLGDQSQRSGTSNDPVNTATGNFTHEVTDLSVRAHSGTLAFTRFYNSLDPNSGPLGPGWTHSYNIRLTRTGDWINVNVRWADGRTDYWRNESKEYGGNYVPQIPGLYTTVKRNQSGTWTVQTKDLVTYNFYMNGCLHTIVDRNGNAVTLTYEFGLHGDGPVSIKDDTGRGFTLSYNQDGLLASVKDASATGRSVTYEYVSGRLTGVKDVLGNSIRYSYDDKGYLSTVADQRGVVTVANSYDPNGHVLEQTDGNGNRTCFAYNTPQRKQTTITDPTGGVVVHRHGSGYQLLSIQEADGRTIRYDYDGDLNRTGITDRNGHSYKFSYDSRGNVVEQREPDDPNDPDDGGVTTLEYKDPRFPDLPTKKTDPLGHATLWEYDAKGNVARQVDPDGHSRSWTYNAWGDKLTETEQKGNTTTFRYDAKGLLIETVGPEANHAWYGYDSLSRLTHLTDGRGTGTGDPAHTVVTTYDNADRVLSVAGPITSARYAYDAVGNRISLTNGRGFLTLFSYDKDSNLLRTERVVPGSPSQATEYQYDQLNRKVAEIDANGNKKTYQYDIRGNLTKATDAKGNQTLYTVDPQGNILAVTDGSGVTVSYEYDSLNRKIHQCDELGNHWRWQYDRLGQMTRHTDPVGSVTRYVYDARGKLISVVDPAANATEYEYDAAGNLTQVTDAGGRVVEKRYYDRANRPTRKQDGLGNAHTYTYDGAGNKATETDANGHLKRYTYDAQNRLSDIRYADATQVTFAYDGNGNLTQMVDHTGTTTYVFDPLDRLLTSTDSFGKTVGYGYDLVGNRTSLTYPAGTVNPARTVTYTYDSANLLDKIVDWSGRIWDYDVDGVGRITRLLYPNGVVKEQTYDEGGRLLTLGYTRSDGSEVCSFSYARDARGNPVHITESGTLNSLGLPTVEIDYAYDENNRLISCSEPDEAYTYDNSGNLISRSTGGTPLDFVYDGDSRLISSTEPATYGYDNNGNTIQRVSQNVTTAFAYDFENRMLSQATDGSVVDHVYDGAGNRIARIDKGVATRYILDHGRSMSHVLCETNDTGEITAYYVHGAEIVGRLTADGTETFYHTNHIGTVVALTDEGANLTDRYSNTSYGIPTGCEGSASSPFRYVGGAGAMFDADGVYFMRARFYDAAAGRFVSKDPLPGSVVSPITLNPYIYAMGNPLRVVDPDGRCPESYQSLMTGTWSSSPLLQEGTDLVRRTAGALIDSTLKTTGVGTILNAALDLSLEPDDAANIVPRAGAGFAGGLAAKVGVGAAFVAVTGTSAPAWVPIAATVFGAYTVANVYDAAQPHVVQFFGQTDWSSGFDTLMNLGTGSSPSPFSPTSAIRGGNSWMWKLRPKGPW